MVVPTSARVGIAGFFTKSPQHGFRAAGFFVRRVDALCPSCLLRVPLLQ